MKTIKNLVYLAILSTGVIKAQGTIGLVTYPITPKVDSVNTYFGTQVTDPYQWLENDQYQGTKQWVAEQNKVTQNYFEQIPFRDIIHKRLQTLWNHERMGVPFKEGGLVYFFKNNGLQNQSVLYRQNNDGQTEVFMDPNQFSADGTTSLTDIEFTNDGTLAACQLSEGGADWHKIVIVNTVTKKMVDDTLYNVKFSKIAWQGNVGFYYSGFDQPKIGSQFTGVTEYQKLFFHKIGSPQKNDELIFGEGQIQRGIIEAKATEDGHYLVISAQNTANTHNELYIKDLLVEGSPIVNIINNFNTHNEILDNEGNKLFIYSDLHAPRYRVITVDADNPSPRNWKTLISEKERTLFASVAGGKIFARYFNEYKTEVLQYSMEGVVERNLSGSTFGTIGEFSGKKNQDEIYYTFSSFVFLPRIYKYKISTGSVELFSKAKVDFDENNFQTDLVFYPSFDGKMVPMLITHKKGIKLNNKNPTLLYAYGGYGTVVPPSFSLSNIILLEKGGIYAVAGIRGGGEYGEEWHLAGSKFNKQNSFDDFIAGARFLIDKNYTSSDYLAINGGSNGGLLIGAIISQRPKLFKVAFPQAGVLDMLRYHKFTKGSVWADEYGTSDDSKSTFKFLYDYSPYHALKPAVFPATFITTSDHDDRVVPAHSYKFAARLQEVQKGPAPILLFVDKNAGHTFAGYSTTKLIDNATNQWAFMFTNMGIDYSAK